MTKLLANPPKAVVFDLDGTLVDSVPDLAASIDIMLQSLGRTPAGEAKVRTWVGNGAQLLVARALADDAKATVEQQDAAVFETALGLFFAAYAEGCAANSQLYDGVLACLDGLKEQGISMGVITNKPLQFTLPMLVHFGLAKYFTLVLGGDSLPEKKPSPMPIQIGYQAFDADESSLLMVGDSKSDIRAARAAGDRRPPPSGSVRTSRPCSCRRLSRRRFQRSRYTSTGPPRRTGVCRRR